jgi:hypothetical protein
MNLSPGRATNAQGVGRPLTSHDRQRLHQAAASACSEVNPVPVAGFRCASDSTEKKQNEHDNEDGANDAGRSVAPARTVSPVRDNAEKQQDQNNDQNRAKRHVAILAKKPTQRQPSKNKVRPAKRVPARARAPRWRFFYFALRALQLRLHRSVVPEPAIEGVMRVSLKSGRITALLVATAAVGSRAAGARIRSVLELLRRRLVGSALALPAPARLRQRRRPAISAEANRSGPSARRDCLLRAHL